MLMKILLSHSNIWDITSKTTLIEENKNLLMTFEL